MRYDIFGDVHGHASALIHLLKKLGYRRRNKTWYHPEFTAIFLGDLIDRGPEQLNSVDIVRRMVDDGRALAVMGNHEFNAIAWHTPYPNNPGEFLRPHFSEKYGDKNRKQHEAFLKEIGDDSELHSEIIDWFMTLPLWFELENVRVVHACWHTTYMDFLKKYLTKTNQLSPDSLVLASREPSDDREKDTPTPTVFKAVETVLKGIEIPLPEGLQFNDKDGISRKRVRIRWWDPLSKTYRDAALTTGIAAEMLPTEPIPMHYLLNFKDERPVFFGHYWFTGDPELLSNKAVCLDYSIAKGGKLVAYRWEDESDLDQRKLFFV